MRPAFALAYHHMRMKQSKQRQVISSWQATPGDIILASNARYRTQGQNKLSLEHLAKDGRRRSERPGIIRGRGCVRRKAPLPPQRTQSRPRYYLAFSILLPVYREGSQLTFSLFRDSIITPIEVVLTIAYFASILALVLGRVRGQFFLQRMSNAPKFA